MQRSRDEKCVSEMLKYISKIKVYVGEKTKEEFLQDDMCSDACVLMISEIGEKVSVISDSLKERHPEIEWRNIKDMRNVMIHDYEGVNYGLVWDTICEDIPDLERALVQLAEQEEF